MYDLVWFLYDDVGYGVVGVFDVGVMVVCWCVG